MTPATATPSATKERSHTESPHAFPALDSIRGAAALAVLLTHVAFATGATSDGAIGAVLARLDYGVALFFLLSGFLLTRPWLMAAALATPRVSIRVYAVRRFARIIPLYWLVLAVVLIAVPANQGMSPQNIALNGLLLQIYPADALPHALTQAWSLATEASFYAALPLLAPLLVLAARPRGSAWRPRRPVVMIALFIIAGLVFIAVVRAPGSPLPSQAGFWLPYSIGWFALGMLLSVLDVSNRSSGLRRVRAALIPLSTHLGTSWAIAVAAFLLASTPIAGPRAFEAATDPLAAIAKSLLYGTSAFFVLLPLILQPRGEGVVRRALQSRLGRWFGDTSYGVFLWHLLILEGVMWALGIEPFTGGFIVVAALTYIGTLVVADVSYRTLEQPLMRWASSYRPRAMPRGQ